MKVAPLYSSLALVLLLSLSNCKKDDSVSPSNCGDDLSPPLKQSYERDVAGIAIAYMLETEHPLAHEIELPGSVTDKIWGGLDAIFRSTLPQRDSIFSQYCVHHVVNNQAVYSCIAQVNEDSEVARAWASGETSTGIAAIDGLLETYGFSLTQYNNHTAVIRTDRLLNMPAFARALKASHRDITNAQPNLLTAGAGRIYYNQTHDIRYYDFVFEWHDCYDLCDNYHRWKFSVDNLCRVAFLGTESGGVNGSQPLPEPLNCGL
ncbi:hypothetical protein [Roseivirga sp. UBA1976]|uniref:hypothetical protein n=1 Tax=Roseivirga sp. UBA1976 TaxID=1947386 RepID=UPI00257DD19A|nr:hypothetical protein [Roseivirga sp. UBA1976]|tara:strand:+ start:1399 stop:2184 length:786 start_codon:yes stop_codon:yes gene_type:complete